MTKLNLNPNEMAIRKIYWPLVEKKQISSFFRPGVRLCSTYRGYCREQFITLRCLERLGSDQLKIAPEFSPNKKIKATIKEIYSKKIKELTADDFIGASPDIHDASSLKFHLGLIYNLSLDEIADDFYVTIIKLDYYNGKKEEKMITENLVQNGLWEIAKQPKNNPNDLDGQRLTVTLINHDYPARTPLLWNAAFWHFKIKAKSVVLSPKNKTISPSELKWTLDVLRDDHRLIAGGLGVGFKDEALGLFDTLDSSAANVGASNFFHKNDKGELVAYNTDGEGFVYGLKNEFPELEDLKDKKVILLGSGGTANAIAFALASLGVKLIIANRTQSKAESLVEKIKDYYHFSQQDQVRAIAEDEIEKYLDDEVALIINTSTKGAVGDWEDYSSLVSTSLGLEHNLAESERLLSKLSPKAIVSDIVLRNGDTPLIAQAKKNKLKTMGGLPMVISQAALAFFISFGKKENLSFAEIYEVMLEANENE